MVLIAMGFPTISAAENCIKSLKDNKFNLFGALKPEIEILYKVMQCNNLTVKIAEDHLSNFKKAVARIRNSTLTVNDTVNIFAAAKAVCDSVGLNVAERFKFFDHLRVAQLFEEKCIHLYFHQLS